VPYVLLLFGAILFVAGVRGKNADLWTLVQGDFTGSDNFIFWAVAVGIVGGAGYIKPLRPLSIAFLTLLLVVLFLSNKGVIGQLQTYIGTPGNTSAQPTASNAPSVMPLAPIAPLANPMDQVNSNLGSIQ
jgi:hypothetical protein